MTNILIKRGHLDTDTHTGKTSYEQESRDQGDPSASQGMPSFVSKPPEAERDI